MGSLSSWPSRSHCYEAVTTRSWIRGLLFHLHFGDTTPFGDSDENMDPEGGGAKPNTARKNTQGEETTEQMLKEEGSWL